MLTTERPPSEAADNAYPRLLEVASALSAEHDRERLLEMIVEHAMEIAGADAGGLYLRGADDALAAAIVRNRTAAGLVGTGDVPLPSIPLYLPESGAPNHGNVESHVALTGCCLNLADAYAPQAPAFDGSKARDQANGYRSISYLSLPLKTAEGRVIGVLQLINAADTSGRIVPFDVARQPVIEALANQAAVALENQQLLENRAEMFNALVRVLAAAIDAKSPNISMHCQRVPVIYEMLADAACATTEGPCRDFRLSEEERHELRLAAWLHDCGKVATPEHVVDKATKLETVRDRLAEIAVRFEVIKREEEIHSLKKIIKDPDNAADYRADLYVRLRRLDDDPHFLAEVNRGDELMTEEMQERVRAIATLRWRDQNGLARPLLEADEVENLCIRSGTLNDAERRIINRHVETSIEMLAELPFPKELARIPEIVGAHHEKIDGSGYPNGLTGDEMSLPARMLVIADIFEALTAGDRPYKKAKTLQEALQIMAAMRDDGKIDADLFDLFLTSRVWQDYADRYMQVDLRNGVDIELLRGDAADTESTSWAEAG
ncbi:MAG: HD domain-containing phosphohydrolase [Alphaproteobacteria bacterium]|jgi:HD-GYP domain-containing protein (c-di-GMP phosphodiesterase class II)|nr:HD domain-containing phosphohydrolase [Alphaproteobacteria bacterium]